MTQFSSLDSYIAEQMATLRIPGLSLAIIEDGTPVISRGYGFSNLELKVAATPQTLYGIGSISKQFTAAAIMILVESEQLNLDKEIHAYLDGLPSEWKEVSIRHLLTHTSGIREEIWAGGNLEFDRNEHQQRDVISTSFGALEFKPGEKFSYSNISYRLLGMLIEALSGLSYWEFLDHKIFKPLGMTETRSSDPKKIIPNRAAGYGCIEDCHENRDAVTESAAFSQGALMSTVLDLAKWDEALYGEQILKKSSLEEMWTSGNLNNGSATGYGLGWFINKEGNKKTVFHSGGLPGFTTFICRNLSSKTTLILLSNLEWVAILDIANSVAEHYCRHEKKRHIKAVVSTPLRAPRSTA